VGGNSQLFDNGTNVGIGTTTPSAKLDLNATSGTALKLNVASGEKAIDIGSNGIISLDYPSLPGQRLIVTESGFLGLGTATPNSKLNIIEGQGGIPFAVARIHQNNCGPACGQTTGKALQLVNDNISDINNGAILSFADPINITNNDEGAATINLVERTSASGFGGLAFRTRSSAGFSEKMRISANGNVGIGTINPAPFSKLHVQTVQANFRVVDWPGFANQTIATVVQGTDDFNPQNRITNDNSEFTNFYDYGMDGSGSFVIERNDVAKLTLDQQGYFSVCKTADNSSGNMGIGNQGFSNAKLCVTSDQDFGLYVDAPTSAQFGLYLNGEAAKPGGSSWIVASDARLKTNVNKFSEGLSQILKINPVKFHYNSKSGFNTTTEHVGVIAQELKEVAPYMVGSFINQADKQEYLDVNNNAMTYMLINAIKEQQAQIEALKAEIEALKNK